MATPDATTIQAVVTVVDLARRLFGGLFSDKDYPYVRVDMAILNGRPQVLAVVSLDGTNTVEWTGLGNEIVDKMTRRLSNLGVLDDPNIHLPSTSIGYNNQRPGSVIDTGFFVGRGRQGFDVRPERMGLRTLNIALQYLFTIQNQMVVGLPPGKVLWRATGDAEDEVIDTVGTEDTALDGLISALDTGLDNLTLDVIDGLDALITNNTTTTATALNSFTQTLDNQIAQQNNFLSSLISGLLGGLTQQQSSIDFDLNGFIQAVLQMLDAALGAVTTTSVTAQAALVDTADTALAENTNTLAELVRRILDILDGDISVSDTSTGDLSDFLEDLLEGISGTQADVLRTTGNIILDGLEDILGGLDSTLDDFIDALPDGLRDIVDVLLRVEGRLNPLKTVTEILLGQDTKDDINNTRDDIIDEQRERLNNWIQELIVPGELFGHELDQCFTDWERQFPEGGFARVAMNFLIQVINVIALPIALSAMRTQSCAEEYASTHPFRHLEPPDSVVAAWRRLIPHSEMVRNIKRTGLNDNEAVILSETARPLTDPTVTIAMWLRGILTEAEFDAVFEGQGWTDAFISAYKEIAFFIPPAQDLISMAVREAFNPAAVAENQQDANFPPEFEEWGAKQGISSFWAHKYWQAHWVLPSVQMGFEMLHRQVIDEGELKRLMQALDIMPGWVDKLIEISFTPFSRVDIRRMHKLGVLSDPDVVKAYRDIGYSEDDSQLQLQFVKELNAEDDSLADELLEDITRSNVVGFYTDGVINRLVANGLLLAMGINPVAAELFLDQADLDIERRERKEETNIIIDDVKLGEIDIFEAEAQMDLLNLQPREKEIALNKLSRAQLQNRKLPSLADGTKMFKQGIISENQYMRLLRNLGYNQVWAERYMQLATVGDIDG